MNKDKLKEVGSKLDITPQDMKNMRWERFRENWIYPLTGAVLVGFSAFFGWFFGRNREKLVSRETGEEYPFSPNLGVVVLVLGFPVLATGSAVATYLARKQEGEKRRTALRLGFLMVIISLVLSILVFMVVHDLSRPVDYYSGSIKYGVYSKEEGTP